MPHKIETAPTGRASCRGCKQAIAKGELRFGEEFQNAYSEDGGMSFRYWHLKCAAGKLANELRAALRGYEGNLDDIPDRAEIEAITESHIRPEMPHAERAPNGRARCKGCDEAIGKGELRVAFERVFEGRFMGGGGAQKSAAYTHPVCAARYLEREKEQGREGPDREMLATLLKQNSKLDADDTETVRRAVMGEAP
jgi:hypothetical protein